MKKNNFSLISLIIPFFLSFGEYSIPPLQASVKDASTALNVPPGFEVDLIYKVDRRKYGSWISMAFDKKGRLTVSDQQKAGTFLLEIPKRAATSAMVTGPEGSELFTTAVDVGCSFRGKRAGNQNSSR